MRQSGDGAGDDQADAGSMTLEREQEMSLANNAREMLDRGQRAPWTGWRMAAEPTNRVGGRSANFASGCSRATLCVPCKSKQERR